MPPEITTKGTAAEIQRTRNYFQSIDEICLVHKSLKGTN